MRRSTRRRIAFAQQAEAYVEQADRANAEMCKCGASRGEHDIAPDFLQPCESTGCEDFDLQRDMAKPGACTPAEWRDYLLMTTPEEREGAC